MSMEIIAVRLEDGVTVYVTLDTVAYAVVAPTTIRLLLGSHAIEIPRAEANHADYDYLAQRLFEIADQSKKKS